MTDRTLRARLVARDRLVGTFVKTPAVQTVELLAPAGFDFLTIDQEHAPFERGSVDAALLAACAGGIAALIRVPTPQAILSALDCGASGVLVPHVATPAYAREVAALGRYRNGRRGFATTTRAGGYGAIPMWRHVEAADASTLVLAQIEDPEALENIDDIAQVDGIDCLFLGRADLRVALGETAPDAPRLQRAIEQISDAARRAGKPLGAFVSDTSEIALLGALGASFFILGSDQSFLQEAATAGAAAFRRAVR